MMNGRDVLVVATEFEDRTPTSEAMAWLADFLARHGGSAPAATVKTAGKAAGHGDKTLKTARRHLGVTSTTSGFPRRSQWKLPPGLTLGQSGQSSDSEDANFDASSAHGFTVGAHGLAFALMAGDEVDAITAAVISDAGHTPEGAPQALRLAAAGCAEAAVLRSACFACLKALGGPLLTVDAKPSRAFEACGKSRSTGRSGTCGCSGCSACRRRSTSR